MTSRSQHSLLVDPLGGLAGDMFLGAVIDLGVDVERIRTPLRSLGLPDWQLEAETVERRGIGCTRVHVRVPEETGHRHLPEIERRIEQSEMSDRAKRWAMAAFRALARAEAAVHRIPVESVHFHEVGAADAILDICGSCVGLDLLGADDLLCGPLPGGRGTVRCAHGELPVPVPAVVELAAGRFELSLGVGEGEMVTPTGMSLVAALAEPLETGAGFVPERVGYGAGTRSNSVLRLVLGRRSGTGRALDRDEVAVLRVNLDDVTGERLAFALQRLMEEGALDVTASPCLMKKGRPGTIVEVMTLPDRAVATAGRLMELTGSLGVRISTVERLIHPRRSVVVACPFGPIRVKVRSLGPRPEYEDCAAAAREHGVGLDDVMAAALRAFAEHEEP